MGRAREGSVQRRRDVAKEFAAHPRYSRKQKQTRATKPIRLPFEEKCLDLLLGMFSQSGLTPSHLRVICDRILNRLEPSQRSWNPADLYYFDRLAHVLSLWHLLKRYVDDQGRPKALPFEAKGPCLSHLINRVYPREDPQPILDTLLRVGAIKKKGPLWLPKGRTLIFAKSKVARLRILSDVQHVLQTAQYNLTHDSGKLLQRSVFNASIPTERVKEVEAESGELAESLLVQLDSLLDRKAITRQRGRRSVGMGIGIYTYRVDPTFSASNSPLHGSRSRSRPS